jgi:hypothetical protein
MFALSKLALAGFTVGASLFVMGCQETAAPSEAAAVAPDAVRCDKCQVVWVKTAQPVAKGSPIVAYRETKTMECPDCRDAVTSFFTTGKLEHTCKTCGGNMAICQAH